MATIGSTHAKPNASHEVTAPRAVGPSGRTAFNQFLIEEKNYPRSLASRFKISKYNQTRVIISAKALYHSMYLGAP